MMDGWIEQQHLRWGHALGSIRASVLLVLDRDSRPEGGEWSKPKTQPQKHPSQTESGVGHWEATHLTKSHTQTQKTQDRTPAQTSTETDARRKNRRNCPATPDCPVAAGLSGKNSPNQTPKGQNLSKSTPIFTKIGTGYPGAILKLLLENRSKTTTESAGISDLVKWRK